MTDETGQRGAKPGSGGGAPGRTQNPTALPRTHPPRSEPAAIALRMENLTAWVVERAAKMSREHKFTIGDKLVETCLDVTTCLVEASFVRDKLPLLGSASRGLTRARVLVRIAHRVGLLSEAQREHFAAQSLEIGKMLGGWTRATQTR